MNKVTYGQGYVQLIGRAIVIEDAEEGFLLRHASMGDRFDVIGDIAATGLLDQRAKVTAVNKECCLQRKKPPMGQPVGGLHRCARPQA